MSSDSLRSRYVGDSVSTASPARLLVMLYDRLCLDLSHAEQAQRAGERETANTALLHAQDIILELMTTLDVTVWEGGAALFALYNFLTQELIQANITMDPERTVACRNLVEPLRQAWQEAVAISAQNSAPVASSAHAVG